MLKNRKVRYIIKKRGYSKECRTMVILKRLRPKHANCDYFDYQEKSVYNC